MKNSFENFGAKKPQEENDAEKLGDGDISELSSEQQADLDKTYKSAEETFGRALDKRGEMPIEEDKEKE